jgi:mRNA interferase HigB
MAQDAMRIIGRRILEEFMDSLARHKDKRAVEGALKAWHREAKRASWKTAADVKRMYGKASIDSAERVVFDIKGGSFRLVVAVDFEKAIVWIKWIGLQEEYDKIDVRKVEYHGRRKTRSH